MESKLTSVVRNAAHLLPVVRMGALGAAVAVASCLPSTGSRAAQPAAHEALDAYREGLLRVASVDLTDHVAAATLMRDTAKRVLLAAKARGLDVDRPGDPDAADASYFRQRLRGVLYVDTKDMAPDRAEARVRGIAADALRDKGVAQGGARAVAAPVGSSPSAAPIRVASSGPGAAGVTAGPGIASRPGMAADISQPATPQFLDRMKALNVGTIVRYYDHVDETIRGKTLHRAERDRIVAAGFDVAVVFQHHNGDIVSFTPERGRRDAERSLELATENAQPKGTGRVIYFGVDNDWVRPGDVAKVRSYFVAVNEALKGKGYGIGVYGSGATCRALMTEGLAEKCWLAQSTGYMGFKEFKDSKRWSMLQLSQRRVAGLDVDLDVVNESKADFGQFGR